MEAATVEELEELIQSFIEGRTELTPLKQMALISCKLNAEPTWFRAKNLGRWTVLNRTLVESHVHRVTKDTDFETQLKALQGG